MRASLDRRIRALEAVDGEEITVILRRLCSTPGRDVYSAGLMSVHRRPNEEPSDFHQRAVRELRGQSRGLMVIQFNEGTT